MPRHHKNENPSEEIFMQNVVFYVVGVMLNAKRQKFQDQA